MKELLSNILITCPEHASRPNPELHKLKPAQYVGSYVKVAFKDADGSTEHLWLEVIGHRRDGRLRGRVDNDPLLKLSVKYDDKILFEINRIENMITPPTQEKPRAAKEA